METTKPTGLFITEEERDWIADHLEMIKAIPVVSPSTKMPFLRKSSNLVNIMRARFNWTRLDETVQSVAKRQYNLPALPKGLHYCVDLNTREFFVAPHPDYLVKLEKDLGMRFPVE